MYLCPLVAASHLLVILLEDYWSIVAACVFYGVVFGITVAQAPAIMFEACGRKRYAQGMALVNVMYGVGDFLSVVLGGKSDELIIYF